MDSSFLQEDVTLLLKDITGLVEPLPTKEREKRIQGGTHYSEMLPLEYKPSDDYLEIYEKSLKLFGQTTADAVARVSDKLVELKGDEIVIVSLARAGTPIGILIRRYIKNKYNIDCPHYSISIIRDRGIDRNAVHHIIKLHKPSTIQFVDGWTGKGAIYNELKKEIASFDGLSTDLAVLADPANLTELCGTHEDIMIPSSCLNCTVSGLISRTFFREDIIGSNDFHGAAYYKELLPEDRTYEFIDYIEALFRYNVKPERNTNGIAGLEEVKRLAGIFNINNLNYIKPGIGETTRVLLRRVPWKVLISEYHSDDCELDHIIQLAKERNVPIEYAHINNYKCCGIIKQLSDV